MSKPAALRPLDEYNQRLEAEVAPPDWVNPTPASRYNLVVIGAGTAGLVTAAGAAGLGAKVALIERELMGGDCLNVGCVPSKGIISAARAVAAVRTAADMGTTVDGSIHTDFAFVMQQMRKRRAQIAPNDSAARFRDLGVDVFLGEGRFTQPGEIEVAGQTLCYKRAVIATGARAAELPIPGLAESGYLTNETVFSLTELPARLLVVGGGPIGVELAQSFARLGSRVTQIEKSETILSREDPDAAMIVQRAVERDGVDVRTNAIVREVRRVGDSKLVVIEQSGQATEVEADEILIGIGRAPNVEHLGLDSVGVEFDPQDGIRVNDKLRTTNKRIFAAGDVCSRYKFTHAADFMARIVLRNALFKGRAKLSGLVIPWCTYTSPELAHVGLTAQQAEEQGIAIDTLTQDFSDVDRAILAGETDGFVRVHLKRGSDRIVGATIVAPHAGEMIGEIVLAMTHGLGLKKIADTIHPYPTQAEAIRKLGDVYNRGRLTPFVMSLFRRWLKWTR